ncbi:hypothetical protein L3X38_004999 [Prunus dulcis]|uniref:Uncharacterized protein n=1 Tax=Prunus dulcis TaxID=3755 RepID=A0AAD4ZQ15_PRUDU|nr:hypothetical protein L3X38_004999 [Prunus dulcis]
MKWVIKLSQYDLLYQPKTAIKVQALADFVAEFTLLAEEEKLVNKKKESLKADRASAEPSNPETCGSCAYSRHWQHLDRPSISVDTIQIDKNSNWQDPIVDYLMNGNLPTDNLKLERKNRRP